MKKLITSANTVVGNLTTQVGENKDTLDTLGTRVGSNKAALDALTTQVVDNKSSIEVLSGQVGANRTALDAKVNDEKTARESAITNVSQLLGNAIAPWSSATNYKIDTIVIRNKTFFAALRDNVGTDPLTDKSGCWGVFNPGSSSDVFLNRSPTNSDVYPVGTKFWDTSYGTSTPLGFLSLGNGAWQYLNEIKLSKIRFFASGVKATYRSKLWGIKFFRADGSQIPNSHFVWGQSQGIDKPQPGVVYSGQEIYCGYNAGGWADLELSAAFNFSDSISKILGTMTYLNCSQVHFIYSNGGTKIFTSYGNIDSGLAEVTLANCDPVLPARYGDAIASVLGETLTAAKLTDPASNIAGRITGEAFTAAFNVLFQAQPQVLATYQQSVIDSLVARIEALESNITRK